MRDELVQRGATRRFNGLVIHALPHREIHARRAEHKSSRLGWLRRDPGAGVAVAFGEAL